VCASPSFASPLLSSPYLQVARRISIVSQESLLLFLIWHPDGPARPLLGVLFFEKASSLPGLSKLFLSLLMCMDVCVCVFVVWVVSRFQLSHFALVFFLGFTGGFSPMLAVFILILVCTMWKVGFVVDVRSTPISWTKSGSHIRTQ
jgi:hypothetical protein